MISATYAHAGDAAKPKRRFRTGELVLLGVSMALFLADHLINIGRPIEDWTKFFVIWKLTPLDLALGILLIVGVLRFRRLRKYFSRPVVIAFAIAVIIEIGVGQLQPNRAETVWLGFDLRILLCLAAGVVMGATMVRTGHFLRVVACITLVTTAIAIYSGLSTEGYRRMVDVGVGTRRLTDPNIFYYWELLLIPCGVLGVARRATGWLEAVAFWVALGAQVYLGLIVAATRSYLFVLLIMGLLLGLAWLKRGRVKRFRMIVVAAALVMAGATTYYFAWSLFKPAERASVSLESLQTFALVDRVKEVDDNDENLNYRGREVRHLLSTMGGMDFLIGRGLGSTLEVANIAPDSPDPRTPTLHISIFNFLLKFGGIGFILLLSLVLVRWPLAFVRALLKTHREHEAVAALVTYPAVGAATALMCMSGGYSSQIFLWLGIVYAYYIDTALNGSKAVGGDSKNSAEGGEASTAAPGRLRSAHSV